jgi:hypothetical protein
VNSRFPRWSVGLAALLLGGAVLDSVEPGGTTGATQGHGRTLAGGYGTLAADWLWLKTNLAWERRDAGATRRLIELTVAADPHSRYFWVNGARMLAYDLPSWRCANEPRAPRAMHRMWRDSAAREAIALLERGLAWHENSAALRIEMANISLYALGDRARAAKHYRLAAAQPDAPPYAARLCARLEGAEH